MQADERFLTVCRYVERNALRANLVERAEDRRWCSLWRRRSRDPGTGSILSDWPIDPPHNWLQIVNQSQNEAELAGARQIRRGVFSPRRGVGL